MLLFKRFMVFLSLSCCSVNRFYTSMYADASVSSLAALSTRYRCSQVKR
jgi:hypothetical protein